ncbi:MAG: outer membrane protein assembly factor BamC [Gammaproteobacteria bacterium]|nr:outer membrane protein assembly factor BamC [Gammaproteobacteria bacterium]
MKKISAGAALCIAAVTFSGCSMFGNEGYFRDRGDDYQVANSLPALQLPKDISSRQQEELYEIPQVGDDLGRGKFEVPRPQALSLNVGTDRVKIQKLGNRRWVLINQPADEVWPQLHYLLRTEGLTLDVSDANLGIMETVWLTFGENPERKDKYRLQVEAGVQPDTTEVHVRHISASLDESVQQQLNWPERSADLEKENWMIDAMSSGLAEEVSGVATSLVAHSIGGAEVKVRLEEPVGHEPFISMSLAAERSWATVAHALNMGSYRLHQEDVDNDFFYVTFDSKREILPEDKGWFSSWRYSDKVEEDNQAKLAEIITLEQLLSNIDANSDDKPVLFENLRREGNVADMEVPGYLVVVRDVNKVVEVRIRDARGHQLPREEALSLLQAIRQNLI